MKALEARVRGGRLVLDEPTELPEGEEVELVPLDEVLAGGGDYLDEDDRRALHESLRESIRQMKAGADPGRRGGPRRPARPPVSVKFTRKPSA